MTDVNASTEMVGVAVVALRYLLLPQIMNLLSPPGPLSTIVKESTKVQTLARSGDNFVELRRRPIS